MSHFGSWNFFNDTRIYGGEPFPKGLEPHLDTHVSVLYVTSSGSTKRGVTAQVEALFQEKGIKYRILDNVSSIPSFYDLEHIPEQMDNFRPELIIGVGGGSVLDMAKILSYVYSDNAPSIEEIINALTTGQKLSLTNPIPFIACPTTAGTGSEVTPFATLWDLVAKKKYSVAMGKLHPKKAILFPELTTSLPWSVTMSTGLDALSQCMESVWNKNCTPITLVLAAAGARNVLSALPILKDNLTDVSARTIILEASLLSGMCIAQTRTAMAHAISYPLTAHLNTPHGIACSFTLPELWDYNLLEDDGRMISFSKALGYEAYKLKDVLINFMMSLGFTEEFNKTVHSVPMVTDFSSEMYTPGRADNTLREFSEEALTQFLEISTNRWLTRARPY